MPNQIAIVTGVSHKHGIGAAKRLASPAASMYNVGWYIIHDWLSNCFI